MDDAHAAEVEVARRLCREPDALIALIDELPDPRAVAALKALAPALSRRGLLALLEAWENAARSRRSSGGSEPAGDV